MESRPAMRYAHSEGHLDLCYDEPGVHILTCGPDGDVRVYAGFDDDDPVSYRVGDRVYAMACKNDRFYVATDDNAIQALQLKDGEPDGFATRFTAHGTHFAFNQSGTMLLAGASDFTLKLVTLSTSAERVFSGHTAPVLSVAIHPKELYAASSSCDGTVRVWRLSDGSTLKVIPGLTKSNDWSTAKTLCRLAWDRPGNQLFVPFDKLVRAFDSKKWEAAFELTDSCINQAVSVVALSPCGTCLAASTTDGQIVVWEIASRKCVAREKHARGHTITALAWHPRASASELAYCDNYGYLGVIKNMLPATASTLQEEVVKAPEGETDAEDPFGDEDLDDDDAGISVGDGRVPGVDTDVDDDDSDSIRPTQHRGTSGAGPPLDDEGLSNGFTEPVVKPQAPVVKGWEPVGMQRPFQPGSTPSNLSTRFMMWNAVGVVIQYHTDEEQSINVEFHDTSTHHSLHVNNTLGHMIADLSTEALLLACVADEDHPSQLVCMHFASWDNCKEWTTSMPPGEDIQAACLGDGWLAVVTDRRMLRLYSISGVQRQVLSLGGPAVAMAATRDWLLVVYHDGLGVPGDQRMSVKLMSVGARKTHFTHQLPLSAKSTLAWLGLSSEGTPYSADSAGIVRQYSHSMESWLPVANLREHCKGKLDNFWIIGISEELEQIRGILCKGARYPPILPRPTVQLLPFQLPLCELSTDKSVLEEKYWRLTQLGDYLDRWAAEGGEGGEEERLRRVAGRQEALMKQFALACKARREYRAVELARMMPNSRTVQLAIRYSTQTGLLQVAQRLNEVARQKAEEEAEKEAEGMEGMNFEGSRGAPRPVWERLRRSDADAGSNYESSSMRTKTFKAPPLDHIDSVTRDSESGGEEGGVERDFEGGEPSDGSTGEPAGKKKPPVVLLHTKKGEDLSRKELPKTISISQSAVKKNPFKVASGAADNVPTPASQTKGTSVFDSMEKTRPGSRFGPGTSASSSTPPCPLGGSVTGAGAQKKSGGGSLQTKLFSSRTVPQGGKEGSKVNRGSDELPAAKIQRKNETDECPAEEKNSGTPATPVDKTGFQLWREACADPTNEDQDLTEAERTVVAAKQFRLLSKEVQKEWQDKAKLLTSAADSAGMNTSEGDSDKYRGKVAEKDAKKNTGKVTDEERGKEKCREKAGEKGVEKSGAKRRRDEMENDIESEDTKNDGSSESEKKKEKKGVLSQKTTNKLSAFSFAKN